MHHKGHKHHYKHDWCNAFTNHFLKQYSWKRVLTKLLQNVYKLKWKCLWNHLEAKPLLGPSTTEGFKQSFACFSEPWHSTADVQCVCSPYWERLIVLIRCKALIFFFQDLIILFKCTLCMEFTLKIIKRCHIISDHNNYSQGKEIIRQASTRLSFCRCEELSLSHWH